MLPLIVISHGRLVFSLAHLALQLSLAERERLSFLYVGEELNVVVNLLALRGAKRGGWF